MVDPLVKFRYGTAADFASLETKDENTLFFITDTGAIYKGAKRYGGGKILAVTSDPTTPEDNAIYLNTTDQSVGFKDGANGFVKVGSSAAVGDLVAKVNTINGDETTDGSIKKALADAKAYADTKSSDAQSAAEATAATANTELETKLQSEIDKKQDPATTLAGYGIEDAYTKDEADTKISAAVANAHHLKRQIVDALPEVASADQDTIYMVPQNGATTGGGTTGDSAYDEYMIVNGAFELIGSSHVNLTDYYKKSETDSAIATAKTEAGTDAKTKADTALADANAYADSLASNYDAAGSAGTAEKNAKDYADSLAVHYATSAQGTKSDTALQGIVAGANVSVVTTDAADSTVDATHPKVSITGLGTAAFKGEEDFATAAQGQLASTAVQSVVATGDGGTDGTITVDGKEVAVKGLKSAAYADTTAFATADDGAKAKTALQAADITTGTVNGNIAVKGVDVAVKGLGSAAYTDSGAYATAAQGKKADGAVQSVTTGTDNGTILVDGNSVAVTGLGSAAYTEASAYATKAQGDLAKSALQVTTLTAGDHVALENNATKNVTVKVTNVATSNQGSKADASYEALTWKTIADETPTKGQ